VAAATEVDEFTCNYCRKGRAGLENTILRLEGLVKRSSVEERELSDSRAMLAQLIHHQNLAVVCRHADKAILNDLRPGQLHCQGDFTTLNNVDGGAKLGVYVLVLRWREKIGGVILCSVLYCTPSEEGRFSKDKDFVNSTFRLLWLSGFLEPYDQIFHISDTGRCVCLKNSMVETASVCTGTAHFRNINSLYLFYLLQRESGKKFRLLQYAPKHGHNLCDSNAGVVKRIVHYQ
jgi:hypothetical protein